MKEDRSGCYTLGSDPFRPEICLSNRIIEDLTSKYKSELMPLRKPKGSKCGIVKTRRKQAAVYEKGGGTPGTMTKKGVTFLDEKLKNGFTNAAFLQSPTSDAEVRGNLVGAAARRNRPKPIASPSEEFLWRLDAPSPRGPSIGVVNAAFIHSPEIAWEPLRLADELRRLDLPRSDDYLEENQWEWVSSVEWERARDATGPATYSEIPECADETNGIVSGNGDRSPAGKGTGASIGVSDADGAPGNFPGSEQCKRIERNRSSPATLFSAVEHGHVEKARTILESTDVDVNSLNNDNLTPLDVAVLTNHRSLAKMLLAFGAQEGNHFQHPEKLGIHLRNLIIEAEKKIQDIHGGLLTPDQNPPPALNSNRGSVSVPHQTSTVTSCHSGAADSEKELILWERKVKGLKKMLLGFEQTRPPEVPQLVAVDVTGTSSVLVRFQGPEHQDSSICTKFKVQWSKCEDFSVITGEREITDVKQLDCSITDLSHGKRYWFRMACGNLKGYGSFKSSTPSRVVPSSWRDLHRQEPRFVGRLHQLDDLFSEIRNLRPENASEIKDFSDQEKPGETPALQRRNQKKKTTIKNLFTVTGKFQKTLKRGIYLVSLFYHDDRVLVTNEDFLPAVEIDETYPSSIYNDLHWFMKVSRTWSDVKSLKQDMEKNLTYTTSHFRIKLLQAAQQMQSSLSTNDLGQLYYKPIRDAQGTLVICTINHCSTPKSISVLNLRWTPISKIQKKVFASEESNISELLMTSIPSQITYHQHSNIKLSRGLYLGYLKMKSSVDLIQIIVPSKTPNVLPHCKVRDNPHISAEEWEWLKRSNSGSKENCQSQSKDDLEVRDTEQQQIFVEQVANTARRLFTHLDVNIDDAMSHRLYDLEVVDINQEISFLLIVPPVETACSVPGQKDSLLDRGDLMSVPVQVFEMLHLGTYQPEVISRYSRLSCILELDLILAQQSHREAFSSSEVQVTKSRLSKLQELQTQLNAVWKGARWIMDAIAFARDRGTSAGSALSCGAVNAGSKAPASAPQASCGRMQNPYGGSLSTLANYSGGNVPGVTMKYFLALTRKKESSKKSPSRMSKSKCVKENHQHVKGEKRSLLQIPDSPKDPKLLKSNVSHGSWPPGPDFETGKCLLAAGFSKSEQHLNAAKDDEDVKAFNRKYSGSDCSGSSRYVTVQSASNSSIASHSIGKFGAEFPGRKVMTSIGNRLPFSKSEDHLLLTQDLRSFKQCRDYGEGRSKSNAVANVSVSATNSPLLPPKNLYNDLASANADSSLSIANTNTSGSLHSISSDESTAAVVSLPVTVPHRSRLGFAAPASVHQSASLMSLAKPIVPPNQGACGKPKISFTSSLNSLTDKPAGKRTVNPPANLLPTGSLLSGNAIPVNINQIPVRSTDVGPPVGGVDGPKVLNRHISSSLPSFESGTGAHGSAPGYSHCRSPGGGKQRHSPAKSTGNPVLSVDSASAGNSSPKRLPPTDADPLLHATIPPDIDLLHHPGVPLDSPGTCVPPLSGQSPVLSDQYSESSSSYLAGGKVPGASITHDNQAEDSEEDIGTAAKGPASSSGVLQVYAAYETGLAAGTSLKLHVTPRTSAREVVDLVVKQLNMAVLLKGKDGPIYLGERLKNFCLVAVIGARERCLRDDFKPLQLQNPWKKGRLYVRQKQDVLAALEHSSRQSAFL